MKDESEVSAAIIEPFFEAVRVRYIEKELAPEFFPLKLLKTKFVVDGAVRDSERHYARCRTDGLLIELAPEVAEIDVTQAGAIIAHELGHALDFLYPGAFVAKRNDKATWIGTERDDKAARKVRSLWHQRSDDQIEWAADSIAYFMLGRKISYCGPCLIQCFDGGKSRPAGLR